MHSTYPAFYPDEIFYSYITRYHKYSGNFLISQTLKELFNNSFIKADNFAHNLDYFCYNFHYNEFSPEYIIRNHTIFPIYKPFLSLDARLQTEGCMKSNSA
ncbi:MAG: hypothetical protein ACYDG2_17435, partial [Ruminiclostridium sp.]